MAFEERELSVAEINFAGAALIKEWRARRKPSVVKINQKEDMRFQNFNGVSNLVGSIMESFMLRICVNAVADCDAKTIEAKHIAIGDAIVRPRPMEAATWVGRQVPSIIADQISRQAMQNLLLVAGTLHTWSKAAKDAIKSVLHCYLRSLVQKCLYGMPSAKIITHEMVVSAAERLGLRV